MESWTTAQGVLTLLSAIIGILSAWRSYRLAKEKFELERDAARNAHRASLIDDIEQVLNSVKEENGRLAGKVEELEVANQALVRSNDRLADRIEELETANRDLIEKNARLTERVCELERLGHLGSNV